MHIAEIFSSIHGECNGHHQGRIVTFIRISGCNLKCYYCDTAETQDSSFGTDSTIGEIMDVIESYKNKYICITGGEPLLSPDIKQLLSALWHEGYKISVETNGTQDITPYFRYVDSFIIDYKTESTGYSPKMLKENYIHLRKKDVVKFVVANSDDITYALFIKERAELQGCKCVFAFSPVADKMTAEQLADSLIKRKVRNAVLSLQLHKILDLK